MESGENLLMQSIVKELREQGSEYEQLFYLSVTDYHKRDYIQGYSRFLGESETIALDYLGKSLSLFPGYMDAKFNRGNLNENKLKFTTRILDSLGVRRKTYLT